VVAPKRESLSSPRSEKPALSLFQRMAAEQAYGLRSDSVVPSDATSAQVQPVRAESCLPGSRGLLSPLPSADHVIGWGVATVKVIPSLACSYSGTIAEVRRDVGARG
jgi:hypothetical protein